MAEPTRSRMRSVRLFLFFGHSLVRRITIAEATMQPSVRPSTNLSLRISHPAISFFKIAVFFFALTCSLHLFAALLRIPKQMQKQVELYEKTQGSGVSNGDTDFVFGLLFFAAFIITLFGFYFLIIRPFIRGCKGAKKNDME